MGLLLSGVVAERGGLAYRCGYAHASALYLKRRDDGAEPLCLRSGEDGSPLSFTPDAYISTESGRRDLLIRRWAKDGFAGPPVPVTTEEAYNPTWVGHESAVSYETSDELIKKVSIRTEPQLVIAEPETLVDGTELHRASRFGVLQSCGSPTGARSRSSNPPKSTRPRG